MWSHLDNIAIICFSFPDGKIYLVDKLVPQILQACNMLKRLNIEIGAYCEAYESQTMIPRSLEASYLCGKGR